MSTYPLSIKSDGNININSKGHLVLQSGSSAAPSLEFSGASTSNAFMPFSFISGLGVDMDVLSVKNKWTWDNSTSRFTNFTVSPGHCILKSAVFTTRLYSQTASTEFSVASGNSIALFPDEDYSPPTGTFNNKNKADSYHVHVYLCYQTQGGTTLDSDNTPVLAVVKEYDPKWMGEQTKTNKSITDITDRYFFYKRIATLWHCPYENDIIPMRSNRDGDFRFLKTQTFDSSNDYANSETKALLEDKSVGPNGPDRNIHAYFCPSEFELITSIVSVWGSAYNQTHFYTVPYKYGDFEIGASDNLTMSSIDNSIDAFNRSHANMAIPILSSDRQFFIGYGSTSASPDKVILTAWGWEDGRND